jgi:hypothetical protein
VGLIPTAHGADRDRTGDLLNAIQALSQLSYSPAPNRDLPMKGLRALARRLVSPGSLYPNCQMLPVRTGLMGLEPTTSAVTVRRSNQAELQPLFVREHETLS